MERQPGDLAGLVAEADRHAALVRAQLDQVQADRRGGCSSPSAIGW